MGGASVSGRELLLAIDQQTTLTSASVHAPGGTVLGRAQKPLRQLYPGPGRVELDPDELWTDMLAVCRAAIAEAGIETADLAALGIANQRETALLWDAATGQPLGNAIGWQDRRTAQHCAALRAEGLEADVAARSGLRLDPTFSATKIAWMLDAQPGQRARAEAGQIRFGTVDAWLLWRLSGGHLHATDATNAARTLLFNLHSQSWDPLLASIFRVPPPMLPEVRDSAGDFGATDARVFGVEVPITALIGNQQAALAGQACIRPGMANCSYGTGAFALVHAGRQVPRSRHRLVATPAWRLGGETDFALEGAILNAGTAVAWLRDSLGILRDVAESEQLAEQAEGDGGVWFVPAFTGFGAPHWNAEARGAILGLSRDTSRAEIARAALEAQAFQTRDLLDAMERDLEAPISVLRVDGGLTRNDFACQAIANLCGVVVERHECPSPIARGAAMMAGIGAGLLPDLEAAPAWRPERVFEPRMGANERTARLAGWRRAVAAVLSMTGQ